VDVIRLLTREIPVAATDILLNHLD
jgi:hypothetical protein